MSKAPRQRVRLRNGQRALVIKLPAAQHIGNYTLAGTIEDGALDLWTGDGYWRESKKEHPLDIVRGLFVPLPENEAQQPKP